MDRNTDWRKTTDWKAKQRIERAYRRSLERLMAQIAAAVKGMDDPRQIVWTIQQMANQPEYQDYCYGLAQTFTSQLAHENAKTWRQAAWAGSRGSDIYRSIMSELNSSRTGGVFLDKIRENAHYIKTLPAQMASDFTDYIQHESLRGRRSSEIARELEKQFPNQSQKRIALIARTEASKTQTALTQARAQNLGLNWYVWRTSMDGERVRKSHQIMEGVLVSWDDPPSPEQLAGKKSVGHYHAGDIFNCRCYPEPMVSIEYVSFPAKVYYGGVIQRMTRAEFTKVA